MRALVQRVSSAKVVVNGQTLGQINSGFLVLLGARSGDSSADVDYLVDKITHLRVFEDDNRKMNLSLLDTKGEALVISQFTLYADTRKGRRPSFMEALEPQQAELLYQEFIGKLKSSGIVTSVGEFGAKMSVSLQNEGPVTIMLESPLRKPNNQ